MTAAPQAAIIAAIAVIGAAVQWKATPNPGAPVPVACDPATMPEDEVCLATVLAGDQNGLLWIDARVASDWKANGMPDSVHLTTAGGESFDEELEAILPRLTEAKRAVVYCSSASCGVSKEVVSRLKTYQIVPGVIADVKALHGGHEALKAAGLLKNPS